MDSKQSKKNKRTNHIIYLDHAATTYLDSKVRQAMKPFWESKYGNPSSLYSLGRETANALNDARKKVATVLNTTSSQIIFTAGGTESINMAIFGIAENYNPRINRWHIITTAIEHSAVLNSYEELKGRGYDITRLSVNKEGFINLHDLQSAIRAETIMVSIMYANNEIGTIEPIKGIADCLKIINKKRSIKNLPPIIFHTDACQAGGCLDINTKKLGIDLMTINGSKMYGPKQSGILYFRDGVRLKPYIFGGGQERNLRSGTENVPCIIGFAKALELAQKYRNKENIRLLKLKNHLINRILNEIPEAILNGPNEKHQEKAAKRLPNNINVSFKNVDGETLLFYLDKKGICVSTGSACASKDSGPSHVLTAISCPTDYINGSIRITLGKKNTINELNYAVEILKEGVKQLRQASIITNNLNKIKGNKESGGCTKMK